MGAKVPSMRPPQPSKSVIEPLTNKGVLDAFVQKAINLATAHRLASERYELYSSALKTPSTLALVALLSMSGFAEVIGVDVRNNIILGLTITAVFFRGLEKVFNYDSKVVDHTTTAQRLEEFADNVMLSGRKSTISDESVAKTARLWQHIKCVQVPLAFEQKAYDMRHSTYSWLNEIRKRNSLSEQQQQQQPPPSIEPLTRVIVSS
jgi:hypothetical protein